MAEQTTTSYPSATGYGPMTQQAYAPPRYGSPPFPPPGPPPARRTGAIIGLIAGVLVVLTGIGTAGLFLFGTKTLDSDKLEAETARIIEDRAGFAPTSVDCPDDTAAAAGSTSTCTAILDGQRLTVSVVQRDDEGNVRVETEPFSLLADVAGFVQQDVSADIGIDVTASCGPDGQRIVVGGPGTEISCTVANAADPTDFVGLTGTVTEDGGFAYQLDD